MGFAEIERYLEANRGEWFTAKDLIKVFDTMNNKNLYRSLKKLAKRPGIQITFTEVKREGNGHYTGEQTIALYRATPKGED